MQTLKKSKNPLDLELDKMQQLSETIEIAFLPLPVPVRDKLEEALA